MKGLVLAGGIGTRLRPLTHSIPKTLVPVANRPILHYVMDHINAVGITEVGIIVSPSTDNHIRDAIAENTWELDITFITQKEPLGLAHTVMVSEKFLSDDPFLMILSDNLIGGGVDRLVSSFSADKTADAAVMLKEVSDPTRFGVAVLDEDGLLKQVVEKPRKFISNLALVGAYCFSSAIHEAVRNITPSWRGELEITDAIGYLLDCGRKIKTHKLKEWWMDCGNHIDLLAANQKILSEIIQPNILGKVDSTSNIVGTVSIAETATVYESKLKGPIALAENVQIHKSSIGPNTSVGESCVISNSHVENCVILSGATIDGVENLKDSVIGNRTVIRRKPLEGPAHIVIGDDAEVLV